MQNPVFMAFHMDCLDPEDRRAVTRWRIRFAAFCCVSALLLAPIIAAGTNGLDPQTGARRWSADGTLQIRQLLGVSSAIGAEPSGITRCALRDLQLVISIEAHGQAQDVPAEKLSEAFFTIVKARQTCAAGRIDEALAIYDSIVVAPAEMEKE